MKPGKYLQKTYGYTDFQIAQIRYVIMSLLSEFSKLFIMGIFFYSTHMFGQYITAAFILCMIRTGAGGLHFKHYITCLLFSFGIFFTGITMGVQFPCSKWYALVVLTICIIIHFLCAPIVSSYRPTPNGVMIRKSKRQSFIIIALFAVTLYFIPENTYINTGFWIIVLQSLQLVVAKLTNERRLNNEATA